jgi:N,N'-diacetyllegionaminate synthase
LIIAEAGVNHNGDLDMAKKLIDVAAEAGADLVKFQTFSAERLVTKTARKAEYQRHATDSNESQLDMLRRLELTDEMHVELIDYCEHRGIGFLSTGFDIKSVEFLVELGLELFKIPSGEITNLPYLRHIASYKKPIIMSTGMATLNEIEAALDVLINNGASREKITILHCNSEYPTPMSDVNLKAMTSISENFSVDVGYSDHTQGIEVSIAAVALGASVIEKHFTLDRGLAGPDHEASLEPDELKSMVKAIRNIECALGENIKRPSQSERKNISIVRKSVVAASDIAKGDIFTEDNITVKRPGNGLSPMKWDEILGQVATRDFLADEMIEI